MARLHPTLHPAGDRARMLAFWLLPPLLALIAYWGVWSGDFVYDDLSAIRDNPAFQQHPPGDWWAAAFEERSPLSNRPVACMTLVFDRWLFGATASGHHVTSLLLHLLATVLVAAVVRAALSAPNLAPRFDDARARGVAFAAAALWGVHPMTVDAVGYSTQRSVLLMAVFVLGTLLALLAGERAPQRRLLWRALAIACLLLGMASKEEIVAVPLLLPLFWRAFVAPDWRAVRAAWRLFVAAAATWTLLFACVRRGPHNPTVGYDTTPRASAIEWLLTQAGVVGHYLRVAVWPTGLRGCYDWPIVRELAPAVLPGAVILALVAATAVACVRRPAWGFLGAWFFLLLAPTSTVLPIVTELAAERRMYLPLLAIVVPVAVGLCAAAQRVPRWRSGSVLLAALLLVLVPWTWRRVAVYRGEEPFWTDAFAQRDPQSRSYVASILIDNYARMLNRHGDRAGARALFGEASACEHAPAVVRLHFASSMIEAGDLDGARRVLDQVVADSPKNQSMADTLDAGANALLEAYRRDAPARQLGAADDRLQDAVVTAQAAAMLAPQRPAFVNTLGNVQEALGRLADAEASFRRAIALDPAGVPLYTNLVEVLLRGRRIADAQSALRSLCEHAPQDLQLRLQLGELYLRRGELDLAQLLFEAALRLSPEQPRARAALAEIEAKRRR